MRKRCVVLLLALLGVLGFKQTECTSAQNLHNLLRHPHYADAHQHQRTTALPNKRTYEVGDPPFSPIYSAAHPSRMRGSSNDESASMGPWNRVAPVSKEYYRMSGYSLKSTSATKSAAVIDPKISQELSEVREANEHFVRMRSGAVCRIPRPQVVCVRDIYPDKDFLPRCTLLHRCTETAGCCEDEGLQCAPRAMQEIVLHFYVLSSDHRSSDVEKLFFVNHTECECQPKPTAVAPKTTTPSVPQQDLAEQHPQRDQQHHKCRSCPSPFCIRELEDGRCSCDCFDRHKPCIRIKRGREALSDVERRCVEAGHCNIPDCEYGAFDTEKGRCPKRPDYDAPKGGEYGKRQHPNHKNPNHRWTYFERD